DVTVALGGEVLVNAGLAESTKAGAARMAEVFQNGKAAEVFGRMVHALGGPPDILDDYQTHLPRARVVDEVCPATSGFVTAIDTRAVGMTVVELGGGRQKVTDPINPSVGLDWLAGLGRQVDPETPIARIHAETPEDLARARARLLGAYAIGKPPAQDGPPILDRVE
ncbi:MAG: thymidine phosphorylase, partial [Pseudomonadota bacterium]